MALGARGGAEAADVAHRLRGHRGADDSENWEIHGENHGKIMGKSWENHGTMMGQ